jgi:hypothetical protein
MMVGRYIGPLLGKRAEILGGIVLSPLARRSSTRTTWVNPLSLPGVNRKIRLAIKPLTLLQRFPPPVLPAMQTASSAKASPLRHRNCIG